MLKISVIDSRKQRRLVLEGRLTGPWVAELRTACKAANGDLKDRKLVVDLRNVTFISEDGEDVLSEFISLGAKFSCDGVLTKYVLQQLTRRSKRSPSEVFHAVHPSMGEERGQGTCHAQIGSGRDKSEHGTSGDCSKLAELGDNHE